MAILDKALIFSSLEKIFPNEPLPENTLPALSVLKNEKADFQIAFSVQKGDTVSFSAGGELSAYLRFFTVRLIPAGLNAPKKSDDYFISKNKAEYPELLWPIANEFTAEYDGVNTVWCEIVPSPLLPAGEHTIDFQIQVSENAPMHCSIDINVIDAELPKQELIYTNWFHSDCLMEYYKIPVFSEKYWRVTESFLKRANEYGMNCVLTPLFTPPLDTQVGKERPTVQLVDVKVIGNNQYAFGFEKLDSWLSMCDRCGIEYYEMSHLFTQWGAKHAPKIMAEVNGETKQIFGWKTRAAGKEYKTFLHQFSAALIEYIDRKGIREKCLFHVSDEPSGLMIFSYKKASRIVHECFKGFKIIDALSDYRVFKMGLIELPVPANDHIKPFIGKVKELWTYYCCVQADHYVSNRFFSMPSARTRVLGLQLYKFDVRGFLHWGYNFYFSQYSKGLIDPYKVTDAGGSFSSGDSFVVYPGENGEPLDSLRLHVFYNGLEDMLALKLLESKIGKEKALAVLEEGLESPLTFRDYPHSAEWLLKTRERINRAIAENL